MFDLVSITRLKGIMGYVIFYRFEHESVLFRLERVAECGLFPTSKMMVNGSGGGVGKW